MPLRPDLTRRVHVALALLTLAALVLQLVLVVQGARVLDEQSRPDLGTRLVRFFSYFTVQANLLVLVVSAAVARGVDIMKPAWQAVRLGTLTGIIVTGVVHWVLLRPLLDLSGGDYVADKLLHVVVPLATVVVWLAVGPHGLGRWIRVAQALIWPALWAVYTLVRGATTEWWPYPFIDADELSTGRLIVNIIGISILFGAVASVVQALDRRRVSSSRA